MDIIGALYNTIRIDMNIFYTESVTDLGQGEIFLYLEFVFFFYADDTVISLKKLIIQKLFTM